MLYKSTRGASPEIKFSEVLLSGLAPDGGLYIPDYVPSFSEQELREFEDCSYQDLASKILYPFVEDELDQVFDAMPSENIQWSNNAMQILNLTVEERCEKDHKPRMIADASASDAVGGMRFRPLPDWRVRR